LKEPTNHSHPIVTHTRDERNRSTAESRCAVVLPKACKLHSTYFHVHPARARGVSGLKICSIKPRSIRALDLRRIFWIKIIFRTVSAVFGFSHPCFVYVARAPLSHSLRCQSTATKLSHSLSHSLSRILSLIHTHSLSHCLSLSLIFIFFLSISLSLSLFLSLSLSLSLSFSLALSRSRSRSLSLSVSLSLSFSLSLSRARALSRSLRVCMEIHWRRCSR